MPSPAAWHAESKRILARERWHTCECSECDCDQVLKGDEVCPACRDNYHLTEPD